MKGSILTGMLVTALVAGLAVRAAEVSGTVVDISAGGKPVVNADIAIRLMSAEGGTTDRTAKTDAAGRFAFAGVADGPYRLETTHSGVRQRSDLIAVTGDTSDVRFAVYDTTSVPSDIAVEKLHVIVNPQPDQNNVVVTSVWLLRNWGKVFVGAKGDTAGGRQLSLRFFLPENASDFQVMQGTMGAHHAVTPWGFGATIPFHPGADTLIYAYTVPTDGGEAEFDLKSAYPVTSLSVISMAGVADISVEGAERSPSPGPMGDQVINFERAMVPANETVTVTVEPLGAGGGISASRWFIIVAGVLLVAVVAFAVFVRQRQRDRANGLPTDESVEEIVPAEGVPAEGVPAGGKVDELMDEIAKLDAAYENDEMGEEDYVSRRRALKAQLVRALKGEQV